MPVLSTQHSALSTRSFLLALKIGMYFVAAAPAGGQTTRAGAMPATRPAVTVKETLLYTLTPDPRVAEVVGDADGRRLAAVEVRAGATQDVSRFSVAVNGKRGKDYEWIVGRSLGFSPDGSRLTFQTQHDRLMFVALAPAADAAAAAEGKGYYLTGRVVFSPDGRRYAYWAKSRKDGRSIMVVDGAEQPGEYDEISDAETAFSPDGKRLAFRATIGGRHVVVLDGVPGPPCDVALGPVFSSDGGRFAYRAKTGNDCYVVLDGKEGPRFEVVAGLTFATGGRRFAYVGGRAGKQMLVVDTGPKGQQAAKEYLPYDGLGDLAFSPDGRRLGITTQTANRWRAVIDGKEGPPYDGTGRIFFSPDSRRTAYLAGQGGRQFMVIDGVPGPPLDGVGSVFAFSPDGGRFAYAAVRDGQPILMVDHAPYAPVGLFAFSPDGRHLAHAVNRPGDKFVLAVDNVPASAEFNGFPPGGRIQWDSPAVAGVIIARNTPDGGGVQLIRVEVTVGGK